MTPEIRKRIVDNHNGAITVASLIFGRGSAFTSLGQEIDRATAPSEPKESRLRALVNAAKLCAALGDAADAYFQLSRDPHGRQAADHFNETYGALADLAKLIAAEEKRQLEEEGHAPTSSTGSGIGDDDAPVAAACPSSSSETPAQGDQK